MEHGADTTETAVPSPSLEPLKIMAFEFYRRSLVALPAFTRHWFENLGQVAEAVVKNAKWPRQ